MYLNFNRLPIYIIPNRGLLITFDVFKLLIVVMYNLCNFCLLITFDVFKLLKTETNKGIYEAY